MMPLAPYSPEEERWNFITHALAAAASLVGLAVLVKVKGFGNSSDGWLLGGVVVFGLSLLGAFAASALYHGVGNPSIKKYLRFVDHSAIYCLIAGTYTPFLLGNMRHKYGVALLALVWGLALGGIAFKWLIRGNMKRFEKLDAGIYVGLGCLVLLFIRPAYHSIPPGGLALLALGGAFYIAGVYFYLNNRLNFNHAIWHLFVIAGGGLHYFSVLLYADLPA